MRWFYCSALVLALAVPAAVNAAAADGQPPQSAGESAFKVFVRGLQIGTEQVTVTRGPEGTTITGSGRVTAPLDIVTNRCEVRYDAQWKPVELSMDGITRGEYTMLHIVFAGDTATLQAAQAGKQATRTAKFESNDVVLLNSFLSLYEALAARLSDAKSRDAIRVFMPPQSEFPVEVKSIADERIQTPGRTLAIKHYTLSFHLAPAMQVDLWADSDGRLVRIAIPTQSFDMLRADIATVAARRETTAPREGDEQVRIAANGFTLAATVSKPAGKTGPAARHPAVVLVGSVDSGDRDDLVSGVPVSAQIANALADGGFLVVRYDKRGAGQSGGRLDAATLDMHAEDVRSVVKYVRGRKDVDSRRVALFGRGEGGWIAMLAGARNKDVAAVICAATSGLSGRQMLSEQQIHALDKMTLTPTEREAKIALQEKVHQAVMTGKGWDGLPPEYRKQADTPMFQSVLALDPAKIMPNLRQPILIVQGALDQEVFAAQADRLAALAGARKPPADKQVTITHVAGVNHLLVPATTGEREEYGGLADRNVSKDVLSAVLTWLQKTLPPAK